MQNQHEEQAIIAENQAFQEVWNSGDAKGSASFYTEDATRVDAFGNVQHGRADIEKAYDMMLHQTMPGAKVELERGSIRMLTPEFAVWHGRIEIILAKGVTPLKGHVVQVMNKVNRRWLILEAHLKIFPS